MSARGRARQPTRVQASGRAGATHRQQNTHKSTAVTRLTPALERKNLAIPVTGRDGQSFENCPMPPPSRRARLALVGALSSSVAVKFVPSSCST